MIEFASKAPMHIFHVITTLNKGGAETHLVELCRGLADRGVQLTVAYLKGDGYWVSALEALGVHTIFLDAKRYADPFAIGRLVRSIEQCAPDIVHAHMPPAELYANFALRLGRSRPLVISKHIDEFRFFEGPGEAWLERFCAAPATQVICISQAVADYFARRWPADLSRKLTVVRYGLEPTGDSAALGAAATQLRETWGVDGDHVLFGTAARLVPQKSIDTLLRGFAELRRGHTGVKLALVGQGPLEGELRALSDRLGIANDVIWAGFRTDIPAVMRAFDVFTLTSIYEGFGLVLLEAMEASRPVVASKISAIPEIVIEGQTGLLVPPQDPERLSEAMVEMLARPSRVAMGAQGRQRMLDAFGVTRMTDETLAVYAHALQSPKADDEAVLRAA